LDERCINTRHFLLGSSRVSLGSTAMVYTRWDRFLEMNPPNRKGGSDQ
jgi:hypothetical protein